MKIALAQYNYVIGDFEHNSNVIRLAIKNAKSAGAELVVFAELALTGYPPREIGRAHV